MDYYEFTKEDIEEWVERIAPAAGTVKYSESRKDSVYYFVNQLGIKPLPWQMKILNLLDEGTKRIAICTPRQVGKSLLVSCFALRAVDLNVFPGGVSGKTKIGIISKTEQQAMKLISDIKEYIKMGDNHVAKITNGKVKNYFNNKIDDSQSATNNKSQITFKNGCTIISLPPTGKIKGYSFSYLFLDEAAHIDDPDIYYVNAEPTVSATDGVVVMTSTPNGRQGFFYDIFDPYDNQERHEYKRFWMHYKNLYDEEMRERILLKKQDYYARGMEKRFEQEYEAKFTVQETAFFENDDVMEMFSKTMSKHHEFQGGCDLGVDFGMVHSHTVLTVSRLNGDDVVERLYHHRYDFGKDDNLIEDIASLLERFNIKRIIPDDCSEGYNAIQEMKKRGWNVKPMNFKKDKVSKYFAFRAFLRQGLIKTYSDKALEEEMVGLQEAETVRSTKISKPTGGTDDLIDCFVMSAYFYLEPKKKTFRVIDIEDFDEDDS